MRRPGTTFSSTLLLELWGAPPSSTYSASSLLRSGVAYAASSLSRPPETVKSESEPVLREDMTRRWSPFELVTTAATTGPEALALMASAIGCIVATAATATDIVLLALLADVIV